MKIITLVMVLLLVSCASQTNKPVNSSKLTEQQASELVDKASNAVLSGNPEQAIVEYINPAIESYEKIYKAKNVYCARTPQESLLYLLIATKDHKDAIVVNQNYAQAYYLKAYAYIDLENAKEAEVWINKAIALSPNNSAYRSELAHLYQMNKNWEAAIEQFKMAEKYALMTSPAEVKNVELLIAKRGIAYSLVEQGNLNEAIKIYNECLAIDPNDQKSQWELKYIENLKASKK